MTIIQIPFLISSDTANGAFNVSSNGDKFELRLTEPLTIPREAKDCYLTMQESTVWWTVPNVITGSNDKFSIDDGGGPYLVTIPQGLYDLPTLETTINTLVVAAGGATGLFNFIANDATSTVTIQVNAIGVTIDNTIANCVATSLMGFAAAALGPTVAALTFYTGTSIATFNQIEYFLISSDLTNQGMRIGDTFSNVIGSVLIDVSPGSQIVSRPYHPPIIPCPNLIGNRRTNVKFKITDQAGNSINTNGETWSARLNIVYIL